MEGSNSPQYWNIIVQCSVAYTNILVPKQIFVTLDWVSVCLCIGEPVQCTAWLGQCILYILIMMFEKVLIMLVMLIPQWKQVRLKG